MTSDSELLQRYCQSGADDAFAELVRRHLDLVYSAALRQVHGDTHLAQDLAQTVFAELARQAAKLARRQTLAGWLYTATHFAATKAVRQEHRRGAREQEARIMQDLLGSPEVEHDWEKLRPVLDQVMHRLSEVDREAILLRFFENRQLAEVGRRLGLSEDAARKRVDRALEKLRVFLFKAGITTSTGLSVLISVKAVELAPAGLAPVLTSAVLASGGAVVGNTVGFIKLITMTKVQAGFVGAVMVAGVATPLVMHHRYEVERQTLKHQLEQVPQLMAENERLSNSLALAGRPATPPAEELSELLRLRSEVGALRSRTNELARLAAENERQRTLAAAAPKQPASSAQGQTLSRDAWAFAGYGDPESAFLSAVWAIHAGDAKTFLNSVSPTGLWFQSFHDKSDDEIMRKNKEEIEKVTAFRVLDTERVSDQEAVLTIFASGIEHLGRFRMERVGNEWKFAGPIKDPPPGPK